MSPPCLDRPEVLHSLGVLLCFREHPVAISRDIEGMFHQVHLLPEDKSLLRFVWRDMRRENHQMSLNSRCYHLAPLARRLSVPHWSDVSKWTTASRAWQTGGGLWTGYWPC